LKETRNLADDRLHGGLRVNILGTDKIDRRGQKLYAQKSLILGA